MIENLNLNDLVPSSIKNDKEIHNCVVTLNNEFNLIKDAINNINIYSNIDNLPMDIVQILAWQFNVFSEDKGWLITATDQEKRNLVKNSIRLHRTKGTKYAIETVLAIVGFEGEILEWFDYGGHPYHFRINITSYQNVNEEKLKRLRGLIREYKNARSYLEDLQIAMKVQSDVPKVGMGLYAPIKVILFPNLSNADININMIEYSNLTTKTKENLTV